MEPSLTRFAMMLGDSLVEGAVAAARTRSPQVGALPEDEVRRHVRALVGASVAALAQGGEPADDDLEAAARLGADRARQGVPVAALLDGFQAGRAYIVRTVVSQGRSHGVPADDLLEGVARIDAIATALEHRMVHAHRIAELAQARTARDAAVQRLRRILHGEPYDHPLDPGRAYHCLVGDVSDPALAARLEPALDSGPSGLVDGRLAAVLTQRPLVDGGPLLVVSPPVRPAELPQVYELCRRALTACASTGAAGLEDLTALALPIATTAVPELGRLLAAELLVGLDPADIFHRELAATALAYLDHGSRIDPTAAALHVHPNTVKYRVRRFQELTGRRPLTDRSMSHTARWWWALRTWLDLAG